MGQCWCGLDRALRARTSRVGLGHLWEKDETGFDGIDHRTELGSDSN